MKSYTRGGDRGETGLFGGTRVPKNHPRIAVYGALDELNSALGAARAARASDPSLKVVDEALARVQSECFAVGTILGAPAGKLPAPYDRGMPSRAVARLESEIDAWDAELAPLKAFVLPGGTTAGAALHLARAVCRRAERETVELAAHEIVAEGVLAYLNRLSSWLFVAARWVNRKQGRPETLWIRS
ncbi:MAG TPA: cob(I)yrinic acid a,c-diamide adenosyltransferase [Elusimicrobia bacterium]|nr:MAG: ATP:cob(I)alamin adenosyltransferase [Elusimicrobia bacterium GWA2_66_18]OGR73206.1 MAG: ATP:cob(I)alamin adenosyltransferase [Elusimicrobia bacterium GWC2_65_9]HAZ09453.1 cob(I)yrinic acid a,c-diamide adenosyltransferase [Elusimicrobiota bacterium]